MCSLCLRSCPEAERECDPWVFPALDYRHPPIKKSVWFLKYKGRRKCAEIFGKVIYQKMLEELSDLSVMENFKDALLIPIPLSKTRMKERGFNQAELIAKKIINLNSQASGQLAITLRSDILIKIKETEHQARIKDRSMRLKNLSASFAVNKNINLKGRSIILIDDVTTTGATLREAKKILKKSGARKVIAFALAH